MAIKLAFSFLLNKVYHGITLCGEHPVATGIFAILGVMGLVLSIVSYKQDREESTQTSQQIMDVREDIKDMVVQTDIYDLFIYALEPGYGDDFKFYEKDQLIFCSPSEQTIGQTQGFAQFLLDHAGAVVFLNFSWGEGECGLIHGKYSNRDKESEQRRMFAGEFSRFISYRPGYKYSGIDPRYIEKAKSEGTSFVVEYEYDYKKNGSNYSDVYVIRLWPSLDEISTYDFFADEYHQEVIGLFKIKLPNYGGGTSIDLIPTDLVDIDRYERTLSAFKKARALTQ